MSEEEIIDKLMELRETRDLQRQKELATEIVNKSSDPDLIREMEEYLSFHNTFHLT